jgi:hypothetical protein
MQVSNKMWWLFITIIGRAFNVVLYACVRQQCSNMSAGFALSINPLQAGNIYHVDR